MLRLVSVLLLLAAQASAKSTFQCPKTAVSSNGAFPFDSAGPVTFPKNYNCEIQFNIPRGYVVKFEAFKSQGPSDVLTINDILSESHNLSEDHLLVYAPADSAQMIIKTQSEESSFQVKWTFIPLAQLPNQLHQTGDVVPITFSPFHSVTFSQSGYGPIRLLQDSSNNYQNVLVFDGSDLSSPCIGRLGTSSVVSRGSSLTLVMFDGSVKYEEGLFLAIEASAVPGDGSVDFHALTRDVYPDTSKFELSSTSIFFADTYRTVIESMNFDNMKDASFEVRAGVPTTAGSNVVLSYDGTNDNIDNFFPQQINSRLYTVVVKKGNAVSSISKKSSSNWNVAYPGRKGSIISQSVWDASSSANYDATFKSANLDIVSFAFSLNGVHMLTDDELLTIEIGGSGEPSVFAFNQTTFDAFSRTVKGNYMKTTYSGAANERSTFWVNFEVKN